MARLFSDGIRADIAVRIELRARSEQKIPTHGHYPLNLGNYRENDHFRCHRSLLRFRYICLNAPNIGGAPKYAWAVCGGSTGMSSS